jgi:urease accessory protein
VNSAGGIPCSAGCSAAAAVAQESQPEGWAARLELRLAASGNRTCLTHRRHHGPLLVQKPLYPEPPLPPEPPLHPGASAGAAPCHLYVIHPPGGVVGGDRLGLEVDVAAGAHALLTTPAAGKFYRCAGVSLGRLRQSFDVSGLLEWLPQENIFYPGARSELSTRVQLRAGGRFIGWELACLGLPASAMVFDGGQLHQRSELWQEDRLLLLERLRLGPACLAPRWGLAGNTVLGTCLVYPASEALLARARERLSQLDCAGITLACTLVDGVLCCRGRAVRADRLREAFTQLWSTLRPPLTGRPAVRPRIWST